MIRAPTALALGAVLVLAGGGYFYWNQAMTTRMPEGLATANGRVEVERVDIAAKLPGRVAALNVREGDYVKKGDTIAVLDTAELEAQLAGAKAAVERSIANIAHAEADVAAREAQQNLAQIEKERSEALQRAAAGTKADLDRRTAENLVAAAQIKGSRAALSEAKAAQAAAEAQVMQIQAQLGDSVLRTPVSGRVEYKLMQAGEVVAAGGRMVTVLDLSDVYMTIFLPTGEAGRVALGSEARIVLDAVPSAVFPATVSFVAAEAQFTPKTVETANEREKLMYRIKLAIGPELLETYRDYVKAGLTGNAYVKIAASAVWPERLSVRLPNVAAR